MKTTHLTTVRRTTGRDNLANLTKPLKTARDYSRKQADLLCRGIRDTSRDARACVGTLTSSATALALNTVRYFARRKTFSLGD